VKTGDHPLVISAARAKQTAGLTNLSHKIFQMSNSYEYNELSEDLGLYTEKAAKQI
jgi:hypothetical protein